MSTCPDKDREIRETPSSEVEGVEVKLLEVFPFTSAEQDGYEGLQEDLKGHQWADQGGVTQLFLTRRELLIALPSKGLVHDTFLITYPHISLYLLTYLFLNFRPFYFPWRVQRLSLLLLVLL